MHRRTSSHARRLAAALTVSVAAVACGDDDASDSTATAGAPATTQAPDRSIGSSAPASTAPASTVPASTVPASTASAPTSASAASQPPSSPAGAGFEYTSAEGDFSVVFPTEPTEQTRPQTLPDGSVMDMVIAGVETDDLFIGTARGEFPEGIVLDVPTALQGAQDQAITNVEGTLISSRDIELQGRPGREFSASLTVNGEAGTLLQRVYFDGTLMYQNIVTGAGELMFEEPPAATFFESFQFTER